MHLLQRTPIIAQKGIIFGGGKSGAQQNSLTSTQDNGTRPEPKPWQSAMLAEAIMGTISNTNPVHDYNKAIGAGVCF